MDEQEVTAEEKDYKYKIQKKNIRKVKSIHGDTPRQTMKVECDGRIGVYKPTFNFKAKDLKITRRTGAEYGEFIASMAAKKMGIPACDVELVSYPLGNRRSTSGRTVDVPGVISYIDLQPGEALTESPEILNWYKHTHYDEFMQIQNPIGEYKETDYAVSPYNDILNNNIELVIPAFYRYVKEYCNGTEQDARKVKQAIIEMTAFDCKLSNTDRSEGNYGIAIGPSGIRFYPLYDNEYILGFCESEAEIAGYSATRLQQHIEKDLTSRLGVTSQPQKIMHSAMMSYLFSAYPEETVIAYNKIKKFTAQDLQEIMDECEGITDIHKAYASRIFRMRERAIDAVTEEFVDKDGNLIPQVLPGNKAMEIIPKKHGSGSRTGKSRQTKSNTENQEEIKQRTMPPSHEGYGE